MENSQNLIFQKINHPDLHLLFFKQVELHTPIRFRGQTHNNLYKDKHKGLITKMGYDSDFRVMIIDCETEHHILPAVAVADAIVDA